ncbi:protein of unknown function [Pseudomonas marincola]|uniref:Uncharacterized protein n=1 Tax=Pseudomonas marincola TaxID=437900 RepID=A0A8S2BJI9_9PSED|nr:protein of unknown function [Pseudomonas marincola]
MACQRLNTQIGLCQYINIPHTAVNNDAFPTIFGSLFGQHVAQQRAAQGTATVDDHDLAFARLIDLLFDNGVVFKALDSDNFTAEGIMTTEVAEHRLYDLNLFRVGVTQIWSDVMHKNAPLEDGLENVAGLVRSPEYVRLAAQCKVRTPGNAIRQRHRVTSSLALRDPVP